MTWGRPNRTRSKYAVLTATGAIYCSFKGAELRNDGEVETKDERIDKSSCVVQAQGQRTEETGKVAMKRKWVA